LLQIIPGDPSPEPFQELVFEGVVEVENLAGSHLGGEAVERRGRDIVVLRADGVVDPPGSARRWKIWA
jgi:hypothetical protein